MENGDVVKRVEAILFGPDSADEKVRQIGELMPKKPGALDELLSKHAELPGLWKELMALLGKAAPILMSPRVLTWLAKQASK